MSDNNRSDDTNDKAEEARQREAAKTEQDQELNDSELDNVSGGALLLPAVQKVREAAARMKPSN